MRKNQLKVWLEERQMTQKDFAKQVGISRISLLGILNNKIIDPHASICQRIYEITDLSIYDYLPASKIKRLRKSYKTWKDTQITKIKI